MHRSNRLQRDLISLFNTPIRSLRQFLFIAMIGIVVALPIDVVKPNDWQLNALPLVDGFTVYQTHPEYVYPPASLILLWPYYWIQAAGVRILFVVILAWLAYRCQWSLSRLFAIFLNPFFIFSLLFSNADLLLVTLPILMWESTKESKLSNPLPGIIRGIALALLMLKPQNGILICVYWLWTKRHEWKLLVLPLATGILLTVPISLIGSPSLLSQWLHNIQFPSPENIARWKVNTISLTAQIGLVGAIVVVVIVFLLAYLLIRRQNTGWTVNHTYTALIIASMLISPYASHQGVIVPIAFVPSWPATIIQAVVSVGGTALGIYRNFYPWWILLFGAIALVLLPAKAGSLNQEKTSTVTP